MIARLTLPDRASLVVLAVAGAAWVGVALGSAVGWAPGILLTALAAAVAAVRRDATMLIVTGAVVAGLASGASLAHRINVPHQLPDGPTRATVEVVAGAQMSQWGPSVLVRPVAIGVPATAWDGPVGRLHGSAVTRWQRGERYVIDTVFTAASRRSAADPVWTGPVRSVEHQESRQWSALSLAGGLRQRVLQSVDPRAHAGRALLAGFLIGETSELAPQTLEQMRRSGLSHFVAVSGSNVALFLMAVFVLAGPLGWGSRRRAILGVSALAFFVLLIGPDPSVLRAAVMAGLVLLGRVFGLRPPAWTVLGSAVTALLLVAPELAFSLGFQLSVAATAGVVAAARVFAELRPRSVGALLGATVGAQVAVAPILLIQLGAVPLWAPVANLLAGGLVAFSTIVGGVGAVAGLQPLVALAAWASGAVLAIGSFFAPLPQLGPGMAVGLAGLGALATSRRARPVALIVAVAVVAAITLGSRRSLVPGSMIAIDVGQGDAVLLIGDDGESILFDTGPSGIDIVDGLRRHGVERLDLLVITHGDLDHYGGTDAVLQQFPVGALWHSGRAEAGSTYARLLVDAASRTNVAVPRLGTHRLGTIDLEVHGPVRRFVSRNDQGVVVRARISGSSILMAADVEAIGQRALGPIAADVLKVPHHGASTSDLAWLTDTGARLAVISVGENTFGHPRAEVLEALVSAGMAVRRTDREGDVVVRLGRSGLWEADATIGRAVAEG